MTMTDEEREDARLTEEEKAQIRTEAASGAEAKRQEVLKGLQENTEDVADEVGEARVFPEPVQVENTRNQ